jgi:transposase InsO family protein
MGRAVPIGRVGRLGRPQLAAGTAAPAHFRRRGRTDRRPPPPAPHRPADRAPGPGLAGHRQPRPQALGAEPAERPGAGRTGAALRTPEAGGTIHLDIKKLGRFHRVGHRITGDRTGQSNSRGVGWEFVHVAIDDASRIAFAQILPDQRKASAIAFLKAALAYYRSLGVRIERVMTDNGSCYLAKAFRQACRRLGLKHIRTRPYTPRTNGKAERFIQTALREWAYACAYDSSCQRSQHLTPWLHRYNWHRPHASLQTKPPISRLGLPDDNLLRLHS